MALRFPPVAQFLERFRALLRDAPSSTSTRRSTGCRAPSRRSPSSPCSISVGERDHDQPGSSVRANPRLQDGAGNRRHDERTTRGPPAPPRRFQPARPARADDRGAARRCAAPRCPWRSWWPLRTTTRSGSSSRSGCSSERYHEGRSGIVLESVAGGWAFRASRDAAEACGRLFERPVQRSCRRLRWRPLRSLRTSGRARARRSRASAASRRTLRSRGSSERGLITGGRSRRRRRRGSAATGRRRCSSACSVWRACRSFRARRPRATSTTSANGCTRSPTTQRLATTSGSLFAHHRCARRP